ncbi:MAG: tripartite tricarboxylate transporter TctB family protein [Thermodesulfobacteriota bacterium]
MKLNGKSFFNLFFILFFAFVIIGALQYNRKARLIPLVVAIPCLAMSVGQFVLDLTGKRGKGRSIEDDLFRGVMEKLVHQEVITEDEAKHEKTRKKGRGKGKALLSISLWLVFFAVLLFLFGFYITIPLYTILFMRAKGDSWKLSLSIAAGLWLTVYLSIAVAAKLSLYEGWVFRLLAGD